MTGTLPSTMSSWKKIERISITGSALTGPLPDILAMPKLKELDLFVGKLDGTLPASWAKHQSLETLSLFENKLQGTIPDSWNYWNFKLWILCVHLSADDALSLLIYVKHGF